MFTLIQTDIVLGLDSKGNVMYYTEVVCERCKRWIAKLPNTIGNSLKSEDIAKSCGWLIIFGHSRNGMRGRRLWYCPGCAKKVTLAEMVNMV